LARYRVLAQALLQRALQVLAWVPLQLAKRLHKARLLGRSG
jgi:hypothetical protein